MTKDLEGFVADACYNLAREILDSYREKGFVYGDEDDLRQVRKVNTLANFLEEIDGYKKDAIKLKIEVGELIKFPVDIRRIK